MEDWSKYEPKFRYMMLSRMKMDCDYYIRMGTNNPKHLWAQDEQAQIENMVTLWKTFEPEDRPEWLTWNEMVDYARKLGVDIKVELVPVHYFRKNRDDEEQGADQKWEDDY
jgi:hypothetical protein